MSEGIKESETEARKIHGVRQLLQPSCIECEINQIDVGNLRQTTDLHTYRSDASLPCSFIFFFSFKCIN